MNRDTVHLMGGPHHTLCKRNSTKERLSMAVSLKQYYKLEQSGRLYGTHLCVDCVNNESEKI